MRAKDIRISPIRSMFFCVSIPGRNKTRHPQSELGE